MPAEERDTASGAKTTLDLAGVAIGLSGAGAMLALDWPAAVILGCLAVTLLVLLGLHLLWVPRIPERAEGERASGVRELASLGAVRDAFARLRSAPRPFQVAVLARFLFLVGLYPVQRFLLLYLEDRFELDNPAARGAVFLLVAIAVAAAAAGAAGVIAEHTSRAAVIRASVIVGAVGLVGLAFAPTLLVVAPFGLVLAAGSGAFQALNWSQLSEAMPDEEGAQFFGLANIATAGASALVGLLGPVVDVANATFPGGTYETTFGLSALFVLASLWPLRSFRRDERTSER